MDFSRFFIDRPIFAAVLSIVIFAAGLISIPLLPIGEYPEVVPPSVVVRTVYPGANPKVIAETVATPLEERFLALHDELRRNAKLNPLEHIRSTALDFIGRVVSDPRYFRLIEISWHKCEYVGEMATIRDNHLECGNRHLEMAVESFRLAQERGFLPASLDPRIAAMGMVALIDGLVVNFTLEKSTFPLAGYAPAVLDAYLAGLNVVPPTFRSSAT